ncbi:hypothetical protein [Shewanella violacea]|uniref:Lipoprotein n=1 Tax=Shewanella violacea (strain JCM 10179 / CIP 106290 / LMG 19151 / DSS12) TaxID=637905 RepID=D4ZJM9_SHEVD|nr:hypothetical protein [Shewanella violacea]BAJ01878.1 hypothetical protein SVI_1907 [Shewanella violacea DSS12]
MKAYTWFLILIVGSFTGCYGDSVLSNLLFDKYCNEEGRTGQFIYERVGLGDEYFIPIPKDRRELVRVDNGFFIDDRKLLIDKQRFMQDFKINWVKKTLSQIGPIYIQEKIIVRKSDDTVLSKSVNIHNQKGWLAKGVILGITDRDSCPKRKNEYDQLVYSSSHYGLVRNTFYKK